MTHEDRCPVVLACLQSWDAVDRNAGDITARAARPHQAVGASAEPVGGRRPR